MISLEEVLSFRKEMYEYSKGLVEKKGHDYNREQQKTGDTLFNLKVCELLGIVDRAERGILTRFSDKFMRIVSLTLADVEPKVEDESVYVTIADMHNYIDYLFLVYRERRGKTLGQVSGLKSNTIDAHYFVPVEDGYTDFCSKCGEPRLGHGFKIESTSKG